MADPQKLTAPVGSHFLLRWTADGTTQVHNHFPTTPDDDGTPHEVVHDGPKPKPKYNVKEAPVVDIKLSVTRTLPTGTAEPPKAEPYWFRPGVKAPDSKVEGKQWAFTQHFEARQEGVYVFTIDLPGKQLTKEVTVTPVVLSEKRKLLLKVIERWYPSVVSLADLTGQQNPPKDATPEELKRAGYTAPPAKPDQPAPTTPGLMALAGWGKDMLTKSQATKAAGGKVTTSCGDVLDKALRLWGIDFDGNGQGNSRAFGIRDDLKEQNAKGDWVLVKGSKARKGAIKLGYYRSAADAFAKSPPDLPAPGDIVVLRDGATPDAGGVGHVGIVVSANEELWVTANGGGGSLDNGEQSATVSEQTLIYYTDPKDPKYADKFPRGRPVFKSVTDNKDKLVDGWIVLDKVPNVLFCDVCAKLMGTETSRCGPPVTDPITKATPIYTQPCGVFAHAACMTSGRCPKCAPAAAPASP
jgi:hypothetical protein